MLYYASRISDNIRKREPEGFLICVNVPIARSGTQEYYEDELGKDGNDIVKVYRPEEEVFSEATIASFEGMPVTNDHPDDPDGVTVDNVQYLGKGHCQNVRRGTDNEKDLLIADLIIMDQQTIQEILDGKREISCGYTYELDESNGRYVQRQIRGNHIAIVDKGRAGHRVCIKDSAPINERSKSKMAKKAKKNHIGILSKMLARFAVDAEPEELEEAVDAVEDITGAPTEQPVPPEVEDEDPEEVDPMEARLKALEDSIAELKKANDEPEAPEEETDPLARLEKDLDALEGEEEPEEEPINPDEDPDEQESHFVDPEVINEQDSEDETEEAEEVEFEESADCKARDAVRDMAKAMKPFIAKLPKADQKKAVDALSARLRKAYGKPAKAETNGYAKLMKARKKTGDSKKSDPSALGKSIMASRNPNYTK